MNIGQYFINNINRYIQHIKERGKPLSFIFTYLQIFDKISNNERIIIMKYSDINARDKTVKNGDVVYCVHRARYKYGSITSINEIFQQVTVQFDKDSFIYNIDCVEFVSRKLTDKIKLSISRIFSHIETETDGEFADDIMRDGYNEML